MAQLASEVSSCSDIQQQEKGLGWEEEVPVATGSQIIFGKIVSFSKASFSFYEKMVDKRRTPVQLWLQSGSLPSISNTAAKEISLT